jgi:N-acetylneuraminate lyase
MQGLGLEGLIVATMTPMTPADEVDLARIPELVAHYERHGIAALYVLGSTGEGVSLTEEERRQVAEAFVAAAAGRLKVFVQVGHTSLKTSVRLAAHAAEIGADAISATPPGYFKPASETDVVAGLAEIVAAAPDLPFYYYHIPALSGVALDPVALTRIAHERLPNFAGVKYSDPATLYHLPLLQAVDARLEFFSGADEAYLQCLALGYRVAIGSTYGFAAPLFHRVRAAFAAGDWAEARLWQGRAVEMIRAIFATCGRGGLKTMMALVGVDCGPSRWPIAPVSPEQKEALRKALDRMGWFEWIKP